MDQIFRVLTASCPRHRGPGPRLHSHLAVWQSLTSPDVSACTVVLFLLKKKNHYLSKHKSFSPKNSFLDVTLPRTPSPQLMLCWHAPVNFETWESQSVSQVRPRYLSSIRQLEANQQRESEKGDSFNVATLGRGTRGSSNSSPSAGF